ncbi:MAG: DUF21 domain-containing protein [Acidobacteriota bacterium]
MNHLLLLGTALSLLGEAFFSGTEIALLNASPAIVYRKARRGDWRARRLIGFFRKPDYWLAATVLGTNLCVVSGAFFAQSWAARGPGWLLPVTGMGLVLAVLVFGEILPKLLLRPVATGWSLGVVPVLLILLVPAAPLGGLLRLLTMGLRRRRAKGGRGTLPWASRDELIRVFSARLRHADTVRALAKGILARLHEPAWSLMTPVESIPVLPFPSASKVWRSRLAEAAGGPLRVVDRGGRLLALARPLDLLGLDPGGPPPRSWPAPPATVPAATPLSELLHLLRDSGCTWAALTEKGGTVGILSLEELPGDLLQAGP